MPEKEKIKQWDSISEVADFIDKYFGVRKAFSQYEELMNDAFNQVRECAKSENFGTMDFEHSMRRFNHLLTRWKQLQFEWQHVVRYEYEHPTTPTQYNEFESPDATIVNEMALKYSLLVRLLKVTPKFAYPQ